MSAALRIHRSETPLTPEIVQAMLAFWAEWSYTPCGGHAWSDEQPRAPLYQGTEPVKDAVELVESALRWLRQTRPGQRHAILIEIAFKEANRPAEMRYALLRIRLRDAGVVNLRHLDRNRYSQYLQAARDAVFDALWRITGGRVAI